MALIKSQFKNLIEYPNLKFWFNVLFTLIYINLFLFGWVQSSLIKCMLVELIYV
jgi:hypothetical protein